MRLRISQFARMNVMPSFLKTWDRGAVVFAACAVAYLVCAAGYIDTIDAAASLDTAIALWERGTFRVQGRERETVTFLIREGGQYTKMGLVHPFLYLPAVGVAKMIAPPGNETLWINFLVSLCNPLLSALIVALLFQFFRGRNYSVKQSLSIAACAGFATLIFPYSKTAHREIFQGLCLTAIFVLAARSTRATRGEALGCGVFAALLVLTKQAMVIPLIPAIAFAAYRFRDRPRELYPPLIVPGLLAGAIWIYFWRVIVGAATLTGYGPKVTTLGPQSAWNHPLGKGLFEQFLSVDNGLFWYSPLLLTVPLAVLWKVYRRRGNALDLSLVLAIALAACLHAVWFSPIGVGPLGPRYLVPVVPLMVMLLAGVPWEKVTHPAVRVVVGFLIVSSIGLQIVNVSVKANQFHTLVAEAGKLAPSFHPDPQWRVNLRLFAHKAGGSPELYPASMVGQGAGDQTIDLSPYRSLEGFNYWWLHAIRRGKETPSLHLSKNQSRK